MLDIIHDFFRQSLEGDESNEIIHPAQFEDVISKDGKIPWEDESKEIENGVEVEDVLSNRTGRLCIAARKKKKEKKTEQFF